MVRASTKLTAIRSVPEAFEAYTKCVTKRMQMTAEDAQRLFNDCQQITQKITKSLTRGWPPEAREDSQRSSSIRLIAANEQMGVSPWNRIM